MSVMSTHNKKRNILFIVIDCLRADAVFHNKRVKTPNLRELQGQGVTFTQAVATASTTSPSVASMLTGLYPFAHGVKSLAGYKLRDSVTTLAERLQTRGYYTTAEVTGPLLPDIGLDRGFSEYYWRNKDRHAYTPWWTEFTKRLGSLGQKQPWFLFLHLFELHLPRRVGPEFDRSEFGKNMYERSLSGLDQKLGEILSMINLEDTLVLVTGDHGDGIHGIAFEKYGFKIRHIIRRLLRKNKKFVTRFSNNLFKIGHGFHMFDYLIRVPLLIFAKAWFPEPKIVTHQVRHVDIFPTLLEMTGVDFSFNIHGKSLMPVIEEKENGVPFAYMEAVGRGILESPENWLRGLRSPKYKYVEGMYNKDIPKELYDLENDPEETTNIAMSEPGVTEWLRGELSILLRKPVYCSSGREQRLSESEEQRMKAELRSLGYMD